MNFFSTSRWIICWSNNKLSFSKLFRDSKDRTSTRSSIRRVKRYSKVNSKNIFLVESQMCNSRFCVLTSFLFIYSQPKKKMIVVPEIALELVGLLIWKLLNLMDTKMKLFICTDPIDVLPLVVVVVVSSNRWKSILHLELWLDQLNKNGNYIYDSKIIVYILAKIC